MVEFYINGFKYLSIQINNRATIKNVPYNNGGNNILHPAGLNEIYVENIAKDSDKYEIFQRFVEIGPIWKFRMMVGLSGHNRGFAYVQYIHEQHYIEALQNLNGQKLLGNRIKVRPSHDKRVLCLLNINTNHEALLTHLHEMLQIEVDGNIIQGGRKIIMLRFKTNRDAELGRHKINTIVRNFGPNAVCTWANE